MSWDVAIVRIRGSFRPIDDVEDGDYRPLGSHASVVKAIRAAFPKAEWSDDNTHAAFDSGEYTIEFDLDSVEEGQTILLHVGGSGDPIPSIVEFTTKNGWVAVDCSSSEFIDPDDPSYEGWEGYQDLL